MDCSAFHAAAEYHALASVSVTTCDLRFDTRRRTPRAPQWSQTFAWRVSEAMPVMRWMEPTLFQACLQSFMIAVFASHCLAADATSHLASASLRLRARA